MDKKNQSLPAQLDDFEPGVRRRALEELKVRTPPGKPMTPLHVNLHCHTFFSYNGYGASPSRVAWEAYEKGWHAAGICDFDVLDGLAEFLAAGDLLGIRASVNVETRVFFREYAEHVINSPGEPGVYYFMGAGFVREPPAGSFAATQLERMRAGAARRNRDVVERVNAYLAPLTLDYDRQVLPLTPKGNATERHICTAYFEAAKELFTEREKLAGFWAEKLAVDREEIVGALDQPMNFNDLARAKLIKRGGPGYVQPNQDTFPLLDDVIKMVLECRAVPMATWLDGTSPGEENIAELLECQIAKGIAALNIVPDRNWNLKDPDERARKIARFHECVEAADRLQLPINAGTELNKYGQRWIDDFAAGPMKQVAASFVRGARIMIGHTRLLRFADFSYIGDEAKAEYPDLTARNDFFAAAGALPAPNEITLEKLKNGSPSQNYAIIQDAARRHTW